MEMRFRNASAAQTFLGNLSNIVGDEGIKTKVTVAIAAEEYVKLGATIIGSIWIAYLGTVLFKVAFNKK